LRHIVLLHMPALFASPLFLSLHSAPLAFLPSFPTRRSSDLVCCRLSRRSSMAAFSRRMIEETWVSSTTSICWAASNSPTSPRSRSEEHTSELQSRFDLVCRLLLEKKNIDYGGE